MFLGSARMELPKDGMTWCRLFPWEGKTCRNRGWGKAKVQEMLGQVGCDISRVPEGHCLSSIRSQGESSNKQFRHSRVCFPRSKIPLTIGMETCPGALRALQLL